MTEEENEKECPKCGSNRVVPFHDVSHIHYKCDECECTWTEKKDDEEVGKSIRKQKKKQEELGL